MTRSGLPELATGVAVFAAMAVCYIVIGEYVSNRWSVAPKKPVMTADDARVCIENNAKLSASLAADTTTPPQVIASRLRVLNQHSLTCIASLKKGN